MAIRLIEEYPNRVGAPTADYPHGVPRNKSTPTATDGTPFEQSWFRDQEGFFQGLMETAGITPSGQPDTVLNSDYLDALNRVTNGVIEVDMAGAADVSLSAYQGRVAALKLTGALAADVDLIVPDTERMYWIIDETAGDFSVTVKTAAGTGVKLFGEASAVRSDGTNVVPFVNGMDRRVIYVDTIADLQALDTSSLAVGQAAKITNGGRAGDFVWTTGDQSANVVSDTQEGIWIAPDDDATGASGAWKRIISESGAFLGWWTDGIVGDQSAAINTAISWCEDNETPLLGRGLTYQVDGTLEIDPAALTFNGGGCSFDCSANTGSSFIKFKHTFVDNSDIYGIARNVLEGFHAKGPGKETTGSIGIDFGADSTHAPYVSIRNAAIESFEKNVVGSDNVYLVHFYNTHLYRAATSVEWPPSLDNSGERVTFTGCTIFNNDVGIDNQFADIHLIGVSLDYNDRHIYCRSGGLVFGSDVFLEGNKYTHHWLEVEDSVSTIQLKNVRLFLKGPATVTKELGHGNNSTGGIFFDGVSLGASSSVDYQVNNLIKGKGRVNYLQPLLSSGVNATGAENENRLVYGGFEDGAIYDWTTEGTSPTNSTTSPKSGTNHLRFEPASGEYSRIKQSFQCAPGSIPSFIGWVKGDLSSSTDDFLIIVRYLDHQGASSELSKHQRTVTYNSGTIPSSYERFATSPFDPAPAGTDKIEVVIHKGAPGTTSDGNGFVDLDDLSLTIS